MAWLVIILLFIFISLFFLFQFLVIGLISVPWVRTSNNISSGMLELAGVSDDDVVLDLGSGDGSIVLTAARQMGARGVGIEQLGLLVVYAKLRARWFGVENRVCFSKGDIFTEDLPKATVITSYLFDGVHNKLEPILIDQFESGTRVVSRAFTFPNLPLIKTTTIGRERVYLYEIP